MQDPSQVKQLSQRRRDGSRKRNLFKQNANHAPLGDGKPQPAPDSSVVLGSRNLLEKKTSAIMIEKKNTNSLILDKKSKSMKESVIEANVERNMGINPGHEPGENI